MPQPPPRHVARDLARLIESEALGEAFFATAAQHSDSEPEHRAWTALRDLETRTMAGVSSFVQRAELPRSAENRLASTAGSSGASGLRLVSFENQLKVIRYGTKRYLPAFLRLAEHYRRSDDARFFDYVVQHELAIISFTTRALAAESDALDPVLRLLDEPVPGA